jgi:CRISPR type III-A-associated protein Csm2
MAEENQSSGGGTLSDALASALNLDRPKEAAKEPAKEMSAEAPKVEESPEPAKAESAKGDDAKQDSPKSEQPQRQGRPQGQQPRGDRPPRPQGGPQGQGGARPDQREHRGGGDRGERRGPGGDRHGDRGGERREGGRPGGRPFDGPGADIELEKLISDSLYLDNQAHAVVIRMRDMDSGTKSQLRRLYNAVRRAVRAPESERQHQFVMLRARLAYTIARHSLRSLDALERLLLQVTRRNDARGYERFKDLFEAIVAYNE